MKRLFKHHYSFIFLLPILMSSDDNGGACASSEAKCLSASEARQVIVGNTLQRTDKDVFALMRSDGSITAKLPGNVLDQGKWRIMEKGEICVQWQTRADKKENCGKVASLGDSNYQWNDLKFKIYEGNIKNL